MEQPPELPQSWLKAGSTIHEPCSHLIGLVGREGTAREANDRRLSHDLFLLEMKLLLPNGPRLSCGRNARWRKDVE
jgi:hypothetical protein